MERERGGSCTAGRGRDAAEGRSAARGEQELGVDLGQGRRVRTEAEEVRPVRRATATQQAARRKAGRDRAPARGRSNERGSVERPGLSRGRGRPLRRRRCETRWRRQVCQQRPENDRVLLRLATTLLRRGRVSPSTAPCTCTMDSISTLPTGSGPISRASPCRSSASRTGLCPTSASATTSTNMAARLSGTPARARTERSWASWARC